MEVEEAHSWTDTRAEWQRDQFFFDDVHLFSEYRRQLESVASLECDGSTLAMSEDLAPPEDMVIEMPRSPVAQRTEVATPPTTENGRTLVTQPPSGTVVYKLFHYLEEGVTQRLQVPYEQVIALLRERCVKLVPDTERRQQQITATTRAYAHYTLLRMLTADANGARMKTILSQLQELYLWWAGEPVRDAKNNWAHITQLHALMARTHTESLDCANDQFYRKCADVKKRGRRPGHENANPPHPLNQLKAEYILSAKTAPPVVYNQSDQQFYLAHSATQPLAGSQLAVDYYPVFVKLLGVVNACVPRHDNHGWFTERLRQAAQHLSSRDWPMRGLVCSLMNLQAVLEHRRVRIVARDRRYYCCYTGQALQDGEEVWLLRLLVHSAERHRQWVREGRQPVSKADEPLLTGSVRCYYIKTRVTGLCSLFFSEFDARYKQKFPEYFQAAPSPAKKRATTPQRLLPTNRRLLFSPLWALLNQQQRFVEVNELAPALWDTTRAESYATFKDRVAPLMQAVDVERAEEQLLLVIFVALFGVHTVEELEAPLRRDLAKIREFTRLVLEATLVFTDLMFEPLAQGQSPLQSESVGRAVYSMPLLGIVCDEQKPTAQLLVVRPELQGEHSQSLLGALLALSDRAHTGRGERAYMERRQQLQLLEQCICNHAFYFMLLYETLYCSSDRLDALSFTEARALRGRLGLILNEQEQRRI